MAPPSRMRSHDAAVLIIISLIQPHKVACQNVSARDLQTAAPTMPPRPNTLPECTDPVTEKGGYEPVCPKGYFRCCATCKGATCFSEKDLFMSWRGVRECVRCPPGYYCKGCDIYEKCRESEIPGRIGPKITPMGSERGQDCEICPAGQEADLELSRCVKRWTDVCNKKFVGRCVRNCRAEDPSRMKNLNFCEKMKCQLFCAMQWSTECAKAFAWECDFRKSGPSPYDLFSEQEEWLTDCNVDCSGAYQLRSLALLWWAVLSVAWRLF